MVEISSEQVAKELIGEKSRVLVKMQIWSKEFEGKGFLCTASYSTGHREVVLSLSHVSRPEKGRVIREIQEAEDAALARLKRLKLDLGGFVVTVGRSNQNPGKLMMVARHEAEPATNVEQGLMVPSPKNPKKMVTAAQAVAESAGEKTEQEQHDMETKEKLRREAAGGKGKKKPGGEPQEPPEGVAPEQGPAEEKPAEPPPAAVEGAPPEDPPVPLPVGEEEPPAEEAPVEEGAPAADSAPPEEDGGELERPVAE
jgi:hypothetical protein